MGAEKIAQIGTAREGQHLRNLARWLVQHPAEDGLEYPDVVVDFGNKSEEVILTCILALSHKSAW